MEEQPTPTYKRFSWHWAVYSFDRGLAILGGLLAVPGFVLLFKDQPYQVFLVPAFALFGCFWSLHPFMAGLRERHFQPPPSGEPPTPLESLMQVIYEEGWAGFSFSAAIMTAISPTGLFLGIPAPLGPQIVVGMMGLSVAACLLAALTKDIVKTRRKRASSRL